MFSRHSYLKRIFLAYLALGAFFLLFGARDIEAQEKEFLPNFESLKQYECPEWFRDAKFGIFLHWGLNSVPGYNGHYGRYMYWQEKPEVVEGTGWNEGGADVYQHHLNTYGHPTEFGYKDFIPLWRAEKFDAEELAAFFKKIGAKYIVPMAVHHDNFDNWNSKHHRWNAVNMGPKRDIIGEWQKACKDHELKFGVSSHFNGGHENIFFQGKADTSGPKKGWPYDTVDSEFQDFYHKRTSDRKKIAPEFGEQFLLRHLDLIDSYNPDLLYFDGGLPYGENGLKVAAHFYNTNLKNSGGETNGVLNLKRDFPERTATLDIEKGQADKLRELPWQTDTTINEGWFYLGDEKSSKYTKHKKPLYQEDGRLAHPGLRMTAGLVIDNLVDIVSKNGNLLLNVGQRSDGSIDEVFINELEKVGNWLSLNGEAIYGTRPWITYGEGPTKIETGFDTEPLKEWSSEDIRFTTKDNTLYAIALDWPIEKTTTIKSLSSNQSRLKEINSVELIGFKRKLKWKRNTEGLVISLPKKKIGNYAFVFKIETKDEVD
ncbi:alpha-L-fucosidase [Tamlana fucoidanivorans]|uniref:alpha-L-fucosidase n=1 Tax=Allotamlana fucoidanivorans TaxID=2583814 RepID=A0A5C4SD73_9FLAO|nr:alpha-L-fucosidase [Tamlana fucoidanivorans]TNJ41502.1 alpha-amylase [Tamlana fucoidanivorans]